MGVYSQKFALCGNKNTLQTRNTISVPKNSRGLTIQKELFCSFLLGSRSTYFSSNRSGLASSIITRMNKIQQVCVFHFTYCPSWQVGFKFVCFLWKQSFLFERRICFQKPFMFSRRMTIKISTISDTVFLHEINNPSVSVLSDEIRQTFDRVPL